MDNTISYAIYSRSGYNDIMLQAIPSSSSGTTPIYIRDLFAEKDKIYNLRSTVSLKQPQCNTVTYGLYSF